MPEKKKKKPAAGQRTTETVKSEPDPVPEDSPEESSQESVETEPQSNVSGKQMPAAHLEEGVRVEGAGRTEEVATAKSGELVKPEGLTGAHEVQK